MTLPTTPREAVARLIDPEAFREPISDGHEIMLGERTAKAVAKADQILALLNPQEGADAERIKEVLAEGDGIWRTCSGCYETEDGQNVHDYPRSKVFGDILGGGCGECGGLGVVWDTTDYGDMADSMARDLAAPPAVPDPADWPVAKDGPHKITDERCWLARKLVDSKLSDKEAFSCVRHHPDVSGSAIADPHAELVGAAVKYRDINRNGSGVGWAARRSKAVLELISAADRLIETNTVSAVNIDTPPNK